jgi:hypothetical protein
MSKNLSLIKVAMDTSSKHNLADYYLGLLVNLDSDIKRDLISKLALTIHDEVIEPKLPLSSFFGALKSGESAEEMIAAIRGSRVFNRAIESL